MGHAGLYIHIKKIHFKSLYINLAVQCDEFWLKRGVRSYNSMLFSYGLVYNILGIKGENENRVKCTET